MAHILLIEDDELIQHMYKQVLEAAGHQVTIGSNGESGLELASTTKADLILLDIVMPKMNGLDMLHRLRAVPGHAHTPVIILSNVMGSAVAEEALAAGALKYIIKSDYTPKEVADMVNEALKKLHSGKHTPKAA